MNKKQIECVLEITSALTDEEIQEARAVAEKTALALGFSVNPGRWSYPERRRCIHISPVLDPSAVVADSSGS